MKILLCLVASTSIAASAGTASAMCGHQSAKLEQSVASTATATPVEETEAASTFDPNTVKKLVEGEITE